MPLAPLLATGTNVVKKLQAVAAHVRINHDRLGIQLILTCVCGLLCCDSCCLGTRCVSLARSCTLRIIIGTIEVVCQVIGAVGGRI
jgi:hypothetical protein